MKCLCIKGNDKVKKYTAYSNNKKRSRHSQYFYLHTIKLFNWKKNFIYVLKKIQKTYAIIDLTTANYSQLVGKKLIQYHIL